MIAEGVVLLRIEDFQQGGGGIAAEIHRHLVDFIQQEDRIDRPRRPHPLNDPARQRAHIGAPVAADLRLIPDAAQGNPYEFAAQGPGDGAGKGGFSHPRRPDKA